MANSSSVMQAVLDAYAKFLREKEHMFGLGTLNHKRDAGPIER